MPRPLSDLKLLKFLKAERGLVHIAIVVILIVGIMLGVALIRSPIIFRPKAADSDTTASLEGVGFEIDLTEGQATTSAVVSTPAPTTLDPRSGGIPTAGGVNNSGSSTAEGEETYDSEGTTTTGTRPRDPKCATIATTKKGTVGSKTAINWTYTYDDSTKITKLKIAAKPGVSFSANGQTSASGAPLDVDFGAAASSTFSVTTTTDTPCFPFTASFQMTNSCGTVLSDFVGVGSRDAWGPICKIATPSPSPNPSDVCRLLGKVYVPGHDDCEDDYNSAGGPETSATPNPRDPSDTPEPSSTVQSSPSPSPSTSPDPNCNIKILGVCYNAPPSPSAAPQQSDQSGGAGAGTGGGNNNSAQIQTTQVPYIPPTTAADQNAITGQASNYQDTYSEQKIIIKNVNASTSRSFNKPELAIDGNPQTDWESAVKTQSYYDLDLKQNFKLTKLRLLLSQKSTGNKAVQSNHVVCLSTEPSPHFCPIKFQGLTTDNSWLETDQVKNYGAVRYIRIWTYENPDTAAWREVEVYGLATTTYSVSTNSNPNATPQASSNTTVSNEFDNPFSNNPSKAVSRNGNNGVQISKQNPIVRVGKFFQDLVQVIIGGGDN